MNKEQINEYSLRISQSNRTGILVVTYEIIINYLDSALKCEDNSTDEFVFNIKKARQFINHLASVLDFKYEISFELMNLYMYANECLIASEIKRKNVNVSQIRNMMDKLRTSFEAVSKQDNSAPMMSNAGKVYSGLTYGRNGMNMETVSR